MYFITSAQMRTIEKRAVNDLALPSLLLMENAAFACVKHLQEFARAAVVCGPGNNGGDGFAIARLLHVKGVKVKVAFIGDIQKVKGDALINLQIAQKLKLISEEPLSSILSDADVIIDAIFGTGLKGPLTGEAAQAVLSISESPAPAVSIDIPSGVEADTGKVGSVAVRAHTTITFVLPKVGHILFPGTEYTGHLVIEDISIPKNMLVPEGPYLEVLENVNDFLPVRPARSNKGTFGRVCVIAGCSDMPGAAALCCKAAYKAGAGLVHACVVPEVARIIQASAHEVITSDIKNVKDAISAADVIALGPGIGRGPDVVKFVREILEYCEKPMVIDADGLTAIAAGSLQNIFKKLKAPCVITPHPGEMAALIGTNIAEVLENLVETAQKFAREYKVVTLLKDARTVIAVPPTTAPPAAPDPPAVSDFSPGQTFINPTGTPALAKAGSGDVLTGIIAAFMAQGLEAHMAAAAGAYVHGKAGRIAAEGLSVYSVCAGDVADNLPYVFTDTTPTFQ